jgi:hypothetical protein
VITEAKKASNAAWDKENMVYQTVKVRKEILEAFRAAVAANGDKVNTVLRDAMVKYTEGGNVPSGSEVTTCGPGGLVLDADTAGQAERAAEAAGEPVTDWIQKAIRGQAQTDARQRQLAELLKAKEGK